MKRLLIVMCSVLFLVSGSVYAQGDPEQIEVYGYSYFTPPEGVGTVTTVVAKLEPPVGFVYPFSVDFGAYEYTFYMQAMITEIVPDIFETAITYTDAEFYVYEDPAMNGNYGTNPPNGTSPSTFQDGTLALQGTMTNIQRTDYFMGLPEPTLYAEAVFTGGSKLGELLQGANWTMHGGISTDPLLNIPTGYQQHWTLKIFFTGPVQTENTTWGSIKAQYER